MDIATEEVRRSSQRGVSPQLYVSSRRPEVDDQGEYNLKTDQPCLHNTGCPCINITKRQDKRIDDAIYLDSPVGFTGVSNQQRSPGLYSESMSMTSIEFGLLFW